MTIINTGNVALRDLMFPRAGALDNVTCQAGMTVPAGGNSTCSGYRRMTHADFDNNNNNTNWLQIVTTSNVLTTNSTEKLLQGRVLLRPPNITRVADLTFWFSCYHSEYEGG